MYIPLTFWFSKNPGLAIPLIALQYHELKIHISLKPDTSILRFTGGGNELVERPTISNARLFSDYIFLDTDERREFSSACHEYLIEQVQFNGPYTYTQTETNANIKLKLNHPVKELVWLCQDSSNTSVGSFNYAPFSYNTGGNGLDLVKNVDLLFNNNKRFSRRENTYFRIVQAYQHHTGGFDHDTTNTNEKGFYYIYSFAINPEDHQPSGTCNFSRIDDPLLLLELNDSQGTNKFVRIYAINYNVFKVTGGMGSLVYSN